MLTISFKIIYVKNKFYLFTRAVCNCWDSSLFICFLVALLKVTAASLVSCKFSFYI